MSQANHVLMRAIEENRFHTAQLVLEIENILGRKYELLSGQYSDGMPPVMFAQLLGHDAMEMLLVLHST